MPSNVMDFFQTSDNPTVLELFMNMIVSGLDRKVENGSWLYSVGAQVVLRIAVTHNLPDGECVLFYPDNKPALIGRFKQGNRSGKWKYFRPDGSSWPVPG